jgi:hypothetical protein
MNESLQKAWDEFMKSDEFANAMLAGSFAPPEYLEAVLQTVFTTGFRMGLGDAAALWKMLGARKPFQSVMFCYGFGGAGELPKKFGKTIGSKLSQPRSRWHGLLRS